MTELGLKVIQFDKFADLCPIIICNWILDTMRPLFLITARGGSKGIPRKNLALIGGKSLIKYSIDAALSISEPEGVFLSTDDEEIASVGESSGLHIPFLRPAHLAEDHVGSQEVLEHAWLNYQPGNFDMIVLLQPTSPFRRPSQVKEAIESYREELDMVLSVKVAEANPYYTLYEESKEGFLQKSKPGNVKQRQHAPKVYQANGAIYVINPDSLMTKSLQNFDHIQKYLMDEVSSWDIDTPLDLELARYLLSAGHVKNID